MCRLGAHRTIRSLISWLWSQRNGSSTSTHTNHKQSDLIMTAASRPLQWYLYCKCALRAFLLRCGHNQCVSEPAQSRILGEDQLWAGRKCTLNNPAPKLHFLFANLNYSRNAISLISFWLPMLRTAQPKNHRIILSSLQLRWWLIQTSVVVSYLYGFYGEHRTAELSSLFQIRSLNRQTTRSSSGTWVPNYERCDMLHVYVSPH